LKILHLIIFSVSYDLFNFYGISSGTCIYKQQASGATHGSDKDDAERGFTSAVILPSDQGLLCATGDQQFMFYHPMKSSEGAFQLNLYNRLVGNNDEILDMKFLGEEEQYLAVATNLEQVFIVLEFPLSLSC